MNTARVPQSPNVRDVIEHLLRMKEQFENSKVKVGIVGESGTGKSSLINAIFGEYVAEVGDVEKTDKAYFYERDGLTFVDLPGCGTESFPADTYVERFELLKDFDAFLLVARERVMENDVALYRALRAAGKPVFVIRNKFDSALAGEAKRPAASRRTEQQVRDSVVADLRQKYGDPSLRAYITACHGDRSFDLERLLLDLNDQLSEFKKIRFMRNSAVLGHEMLEAKGKAAASIVSWYAVASAANAINPIPGLGVGVDVALLLVMNGHVISCYGLKHEQLEWTGDHSQRLLLVAQKLAAPLGRYLSSAGVIELLRRFAGREAVKTLASLIPIIGTIIAAGLGYKITSSLGNAIIEDCDRAARELLDAARQTAA